MGYDLHLTRAENWFDSEQRPIAADEWLSVVEQDPDLTIDPRGNGPYCALWLQHWVEGDHPWFNWRKGCIYTKNPDRMTLGKMLEIARRLGARVQGDEGELYTCPEDMPEST
jgi:hypothetical protein